eukprot:2791025-Prymnesium_polylepis.1
MPCVPNTTRRCGCSGAVGAKSANRPAHAQRPRARVMRNTRVARGAPACDVPCVVERGGLDVCCRRLGEFSQRVCVGVCRRLGRVPASVLECWICVAHCHVAQTYQTCTKPDCPSVRGKYSDHKATADHAPRGSHRHIVSGPTAPASRHAQGRGLTHTRGRPSLASNRCRCVYWRLAWC